MSRLSTRLATAGGAALLTAAVAGPALAAPAATRTPPAPAVRQRHVLLLSVDGLHATDLAWYVKNRPKSALAALVRGGVDYTDARTPVPSDSFPGMVAQATGGNPRSTGIYYDVSYNHDLLPAGTTSCPAGAALGAVVAYDESLDRNTDRLDAGQGLKGLPRTILKMTGDPARLINPANLPVDPGTCRPVYPHQYLKVNTIFEVARAHGLRTAWSDKHPAYEILNGPSGRGVQDLFTPEINSQAIGYPEGIDWTKDNAATRQYDSFKVHAVRNEIDGYNHSRSQLVGTPAIFGMNFQSVSTAQKLPTSDGMTGGYLPGGKIPGPLLRGALDFVDASVASMVTELYARGRAGDTTLILSAKHGQSPTDPAALTRIDDAPILDGLNAAWATTHPGTPDLVAAASDDDIMQLWLSNRSQAAADFARRYLLSHPATGADINGMTRTLPSSGLKTAYAGSGVAQYFHVGPANPRIPDVLGIVGHGVVYTGGTSKIAEHGGADAQDRSVPILISGPGVPHQVVDTAPVETTQIAPTILALLGLNPAALQAVRIEHTAVLPVR